MTAGNVRSLECRTLYAGTSWTCHRQRGHRGEHYAFNPRDPQDRITWATCDAPNLAHPGLRCYLFPSHVGDHEHGTPTGKGIWWTGDGVIGGDVTPRMARFPSGLWDEDRRELVNDRLDDMLDGPEDTETDEFLPLELEAPTDPLRKRAAAILSVVFLILLLTAPAIIYGAWRVAL